MRPHSPASRAREARSGVNGLEAGPPEELGHRSGPPHRARATIHHSHLSDTFTMPELPEVEYLARQLARELPGRRISDVQVAWDRAIREPAPAEFCRLLAGSAIEHVGRRAKLLLISLSGGRVLVIHRKMSGNLIFVPPGTEDPWARVTFTLDDGRRLVF